MRKIIVLNLASVTFLLFAFLTSAQPTYTNLRVNNNNGALTGARFTQTTSSIVAFGNNVVVSYADAGSNTFVNNKFTGFAYSTDGGATFTDGGELPTTAVGDGGLSVLARNNTTGRIYLLTTSFFTGRALVFRSDNNGVNWLPPVAGTPGTISDSRPWITVDNFAGSGNGNVYLISKRFGSGGFPLGVFFYRSIDHGATFGPGGGIPITPVAHNGSFVTVGPDHSVYAFWSENNLIRMRKSTNQGVSFGTAVTVATGIVGFDLGLTGVRQGTTTSAPFRANTYPQAAINPVSGHIYLTYANAGTAPDKADIFFVMSSDGGATWSSPARVNDDLTTADQWVPTIAVTPDGLNLGIFYNSRQDDPENNNLFRYYSRVATISGSTVTFTPSTLVSLVPSLPEFGRDPVVNTLFMVDYTQAVATSDGFFVTWTDNRDDYTPGLPRKDPNIYFARFPVTGPPPTPYLLSENAAIISGNGIINANECNQINLSVSNIGSGDATAISAVLSSSTPGITVSQNSSAYTDIAKNATGTNTTPFTICTGEGFVCALPIQLTLTLTYEGGSTVLNFSLPTGTLLSPLAFHNNTSTPLADLATTNIPITVSGINGNIGKVILSLHVTHPYTGDLDISLISPDGTIAELSSDNGSSGDNYGSSCSSRTIFDDDASVFIYSVAAPFAGTFKPEGLLSSFAGKSGSSVNGTWTLRIVDDEAADVGNFNCATLTIIPVECEAPLNVTIPLIISEFRLRGPEPSGENNEYIEIYNTSNSSYTVTSANGTGLGIAASDGITRNSIPNGTVIPPHGHYLIVNSLGYSLANYGGSGAVAGNATYTTGIPDNAGIALFNNNVGGASYSLENRLDAVGSSDETNTIYKEGTGYAPLSVSAIESRFRRKTYSGPPQDTDNNSDDFEFGNTNGSVNGAHQRLGAPGPENLTSPVSRNANVIVSRLDATVGELVTPNMLALLTSGSPPQTLGTLDLRYKITNNTGVAITRLRLRIDSISTKPAGPGKADLRPITSSTLVGVGPVLDPATCSPSSTPCSVTVQGTTLEEPPIQTIGGGFNSTLTVNMGAPLANGASIYIRLLFGIEQTGTFSIAFTPEILPATAASGPVPLPVMLTGTVGTSCVVTCPANIITGNDAGQCGAVVNFTTATTGSCGTVTASPPSGSFFPIGTTTVNVSSTTGPTCSFTVTVNDTQSPSITCPSPITVNSDPGQTGAIVNFSVPVVSDNCPGASVISVPSSGSLFPVGTTTVTSTATDASGNTATCSFAITVTPNTCPVANALSISVEKNNSINFQLPATDADGDALQFSIVTAPSHGQVLLNAQTGIATYTPTTGYTGPDQFTYKVSDGECEDEATVSITVVTCPEGKGYWKNNPDSWPEGSTPMLLGTQSYTKAELLEILNTPVGNGHKADASIMLAHHLIVAKLNVLNGAVTPDPVADSIVAADILIGNNRIPMRVRPNTPLGQRMVANAAFLESYNSGLLTEACNPVTEPLTSGKKQISLQEISQTIKAFEVKVYPNPSGSYFNIMINSNDTKERVVLQVFDQYGRLIETKNSVSNGSTVRLGDLYRPGVYYVRVIQGKQHKEVKLIKLSD